MQSQIKSTTIICVRKNDKIAIGGDGQVSMGYTVMKNSAKKIRKIYNDRILTGFAGATADAFTLLEKFESKINTYDGNLSRSAVELARDWRLDKILRRLEALLIVADKQDSYLISGTGDVIKSDDGILTIGSGGNYALAAARALLNFDLTAKEIVKRAMTITAEICIYTNNNITIEEL